ncbi:MAG: VWA domain-containing protein [Bacteroidota bacterium]
MFKKVRLSLLVIAYCFLTPLQAQLEKPAFQYLNLQAEKLRLYEQKLRSINLMNLGIAYEEDLGGLTYGKEPLPELGNLKHSREEAQILEKLKKSHVLFLEIEKLAKRAALTETGLQKAALYFGDIHILNQKIVHKLESLSLQISSSKAQKHKEALSLARKVLIAYRFEQHTELNSLLQRFKSLSLPSSPASQNFSKDMQLLLCRDILKKASYNDKLLPHFNQWVVLYNEWMRKDAPELGLMAKLEPIFIPISSEKLETQDQIQEGQELIFLLDVSGSMDKQSKLPLIKQSLIDILPQLHPEDKLHILTFRDDAQQVLSNYSPTQQEKIKKSLQELTAKGKTNPYASFEIAYQIAKSNQTGKKPTRLILITDGGFEIDPKKLPKLVEAEGYQGLGLSILYVGNQEYKVRNRLRKLAGIGNGQYIALNGAEPAQRLLNLIRKTKPVP